jgi:hypothetical protein
MRTHARNHNLRLVALAEDIIGGAPTANLDRPLRRRR